MLDMRISTAAYRIRLCARRRNSHLRRTSQCGHLLAIATPGPQRRPNLIFTYYITGGGAEAALVTDGVNVGSQLARVRQQLKLFNSTISKIT